jgi:prenyltransferase beta subunit
MEETLVRKHLYAASAILAAILVIVVGALSPVPGRAQTDPASRAIRFLASQELADGSVPGFSTYDATEFYVIGAAAAGYDPNQLRNGTGTAAVDYLKSQAVPATADGGNSGRLLIAAVAARQDVTNFGGVNLITKVNSFYLAGFYQAASAQGQALAILGLKAAAQVVPQAAIDAVKHAQDSDGGWDYQLVKDDPNAATNFDSSDTNSTAFALMALAAVGDHSLDGSALAWLKTQQQADGGFPYQGSPTDPDSTALVLQALVATRQNPNGSAWTVAGNTPYSNLLSVQTAGGGFVGFTGTPDAPTTSQALFGLLQQPFPAFGVYAAGIGVTASIASGVAALRFLQSQQSGSTGGLPPGFSAFDSSEFYVIGAAAAGYDGNQLSNCTTMTAVQYLQANATAASADGGNAGRLLLAAVAAGQSVIAFGGVDLVAKVNSFYVAGLYQANSAQGQTLAILGLKAAGQPVPQAAIDAVKNAQDSDHGWDYQLVKDDPNAATNFDTSDTNSTAFVLMALAAVGDHSLDASALAWLKTQQQADGGFGYQGAPSDPVSDALVVQALMATFQDPASTSSINGWAVSPNSPLTYLLAQQQTGGGFLGYTGSADAGTTSQVLGALERRPYPVAAPASPAALPAASCPSPSPTPTATPTPTPTPTPTATSTPTPAPTAAPLPPAAPPSTPEPAPVAEVTATPSASPTPAPSPSPTAVESTPNAGPTSEPPPTNPPGSGGGGLPPALIYGLIAVAALVIVVGSGAAYVAWFRR